MSNKEKSDVKFLEKLSIKFRKRIITSKLLTLIIVFALICVFVGLNYWVKKIDLPEIDVTSNKIYTLSDASKDAIKSLNQDIKIYVYGIEEDNEVVGLIKQYCEANDKISYEMLSNETNMAKVQELELQEGYSIVIIESGDSRKIIDAKNEFTTYDYVTYKQVDTTEQVMTNSILALTTDKKPKVYFVQGHGEFTLKDDGSRAELGVLTTYLNNEAYEVNSLDLITTGVVPEDCDVLAILSPTKDFLENETTAVIDYINKGGNVFVTRDDIAKRATDLVNFQKILDLYGVSVEKGYVVENDVNNANPNYPFIFKPVISQTNKITSTIYTDSSMLIAYVEKLNFLPEEQLQALNVTYEELMSTSDSALYITDLNSSYQTAVSSAQTGKVLVSAEVTKTIFGADAENSVQSKLIISATGSFMTDTVIPQLDSQMPLSYIGSNKDFGINAIAELSDKENTLSIRKEMSGTSYLYTATKKQNAIVLAIIFVIPVLILFLGIVIWRLRRRRK